MNLDQPESDARPELVRQVHALHEPRPTCIASLLRGESHAPVSVEAEIVGFDDQGGESINVDLGRYWLLDEEGQRQAEVNESQLRGEDLAALADAAVRRMLAPDQLEGSGV